MGMSRIEQISGRLALAWAVLITLVSVLPSEQAISTGLGDKWEHLAGYALLACLIKIARQDTLSAWKIAAAVILFGAMLEIVQSFVPGRHAELLDVLADMLGAALGIAIGKGLLHYFHAPERSKP